MQALSGGPSWSALNQAAAARGLVNAELLRETAWLAAYLARRAGQSRVTARPSMTRSFCARNLARAREKVSLAAPSSAAKRRLVLTSSKLKG